MNVVAGLINLAVSYVLYRLYKNGDILRQFYEHHLMTEDELLKQKLENWKLREENEKLKSRLLN